ncbi:dihydrolipoamide acetyltransferase [Prauserella marina]|nr:dihydrolipoamide acetyltransferase [Prauserella marina]
MPRLSDTMEDGVIVAWHKQVGDQVGKGEVLAEIETDKAIMELESYDEGILERVLVAEGERVAIGTPIGIVGDGTGSASPAPVPAPAAVAATPLVAGAAAVVPDGERGPKSSPLARKVARELGVELAGVAGTGPGGRIIRRDVESAAREAADTPAPASAVSTVEAGEDTELVPLSSMRRVAAKRLTESKQQAPHFYLTSAIDVTELLAFRGTVNATLAGAGGPKVSVNDLIVKAVAVALRENPDVNVSFAGDDLARHKRINLGIAVAVPDGLVVPVVPDADRKSVSEIAAEAREKGERAREGKLKAAEMSGGTFTISNLGMFGIEQFAAVINPPEAAILAVGAAAEEVKVVEGEFVARKILRVTLSADHRAVDGATGARFLSTLTGLLEAPLRILA